MADRLTRAAGSGSIPVLALLEATGRSIVPRGPEVSLSGPPAATSGAVRVEEMAGLGSWTLDLRTMVVSGRPGLRRLLDLHLEGPIPSPEEYHSYVHPDDQPELARHWQQLTRLGVEYRVEHRLISATGTTKYMRAAACVDVDADGRPVLAYGITEDITDLRVASLAVEHERDRSRAVLRSLHEGYLLVQGDRVVESNRAMAVLSGYGEAELTGLEVPGELWPQDQRTSLKKFRAGLRTRQSVEQETVLQRKDGSRFEAQITATPLVGEDQRSELWVVIVRDITEQRTYERLLLVRSQTDPLTGLLNSRSFREELRAASAAGVTALPLSLALVDVDHFKSINDRFGHAVGDEVLCAVVERLAAVEEGTLARVGGEEFAFLLPGRDADGARGVVGAALQALRSSPISGAGTITASAGVAQMTPDMTDDDLYRLADVRLYEAKAQGRDRVV